MKVFVSGTSGDLGRFRKAVAEELNRLGMEAIEQTYFGVDHRTLPTLLKDKIKRCDAMICLVGPIFGAAPPNLGRSYTQMEYDLAQEFGKPIFRFLPSPKCTLDRGGHDTPEQRELQKHHVEKIRSGAHKWEEFDDVMQLRLLTAEAVYRISPEVAEGKIAHDVRTHFPTPLAQLYDNYISSNLPNALRLLVAESLRFISLLALHDSAVHRILGCNNLDTGERIRVLASPQHLTDWQWLLRLACPDEHLCRGFRFIKEFAGWEGRNSRTISAVVQAEDALSQRRIPDLHQIVISLREGMTSLLSDLDFLRRYVLLAMKDASPKTGNCTAQIFRGLAPRSFSFIEDPLSSLHPQKGKLYLLSLDRRQAICLDPSISYENTEGDDRIYGWGALGAEKDNKLQLKLVPFDEHASINVPERPDIQDTLTDWLGGELCMQAFGFHGKDSPVVQVGKLLDDASWEHILKVVLPEGGEPSVLVGRFRLDGSPIHRGLHANLFGATDITTKSPQQGVENLQSTFSKHPIVHILREDGASDEQVVLWFESRAGAWRRVNHPKVLRLYDEGDPAGRRGLPFLVTDHLPGARGLDQLIQSGELLSHKTVMAVIALAAEVSRIAHQQGIFLLTLPPRHFLMDGQGNLFLTGFETAVSAQFGTKFPTSLSKRLRRFSKDWDMMAPELRHEFGTFSPTLDVFAIGALLASLQGMPTQPMDVLSPKEWADPWRCLAFHCLAVDPRVRFQSADQLLIFLKEWLRRDVPPMVAIPPQAESSSCSIAKFPLTNREYARFCRETDHHLPLHLRPSEDHGQEEDVNPWRRSSGPWLPATHVSLLDAEAYCHWISNKTNKIWRLPTESEWVQAAGSLNDRDYPWGNEFPDKTRANYDRFYGGPTVVGAFPNGQSPNSCMDMAGNVWEWCSNIVKVGAPRRVLKGGAHGFSSTALKIANRHAVVVTCRSPHVGFRLICEEKTL